ncbi:hypothetical protein GCM10009785_06880 [Brooklawnia cerclae]
MQTRTLTAPDAVPTKAPEASTTRFDAAQFDPARFDLRSEYVELAAEVFSLLSDPTRIRIILALSSGELSVGELADRVGKAPTAVSQHLAKLRWAKVVQTRQEGTRAYYSLIDEHAQLLVSQAIFQAEHVIDFWPRHHRGTAGTSDRTRREQR